MAITITFDTVAESAAFFALMAGHPLTITQVGNLVEASTEGSSTPAPAPTPTSNPAASTPAAAPVSAPAPAPITDAAKAAVDSALERAAASKTEIRKRKEKEKADAKAELEGGGDPKAESAPKQEPAANTPPTATAAPEPDASNASEEDFFNSTGQDANATDAEPAEPIYTYKQVYDELRAWSSTVDRNTFAALMKECDVLAVAELEKKPELFNTIMKKILPAA